MNEFRFLLKQWVHSSQFCGTYSAVSFFHTQAKSFCLMLTKFLEIHTSVWVKYLVAKVILARLISFSITFVVIIVWILLIIHIYCRRNVTYSVTPIPLSRFQARLLRVVSIGFDSRVSIKVLIQFHNFPKKYFVLSIIMTICLFPIKWVLTKLVSSEYNNG